MRRFALLPERAPERAWPKSPPLVLDLSACDRIHLAREGHLASGDGLQMDQTTSISIYIFHDMTKG